MSADRPRRPAAFRLDAVRLAEDDGVAAPPSATPLLIEEPDAFGTVPAARPDATPRRGFRWSRLLLAAAGGLVALALGLAVDSLIDALFARTGWLGWTGVVLAALAIAAALGLAVREVLGLLSLRRIGRILEAAGEAVASDDRAKARAVIADLEALYAARPETARGRAALAGHAREIIDGRDLIGLAETELLQPFDEAARRLVMTSARRVSLVTAISPRALVDVLFVFVEILRLIRRVAALYGGRPGFIGFLRLTRNVVGHLAVTGGMAAGDSLVQQVLGHGVAARISARLGEGVINGLLTARVGIAAVEVCRPLPYVVGRPPRIGDVMAELTRRAPKPDEPAAG